MTTALDEISLTSVEPVRVEPSFTNGGNGLDDASGEEDMEEGEIPERMNEIPLNPNML